MKKFLLFVSAAFCSLSMMAQSATFKTFTLEGAIAKQSKEIAAPVKKTAPRKALAENQLWMGNYLSDTYDSYGSGFGLPSYPGETTIATEVPATAISGFDGGNMVGMRVGLAEATTVSEMFVYGVTSSSTLELLASAVPASTTTGWNQVTFDTPATLDLSNYEELFLGFVYTQTEENYPWCLVAEGEEYQETLVYGDYGSGTAWYSIGSSSYGNLAIQVLVEKDFAKNSVDAVSCKDAYAQIGETGTLKFVLRNQGTKDVENLSYTVECDGTTSEEQTCTFEEAPTFGKSFTLPVATPAESEACTKTYTITVTKVNGEENASENNTVSGKFNTVKKLFTHNVAVEEFTGTGCGWCPRGWQGMENLRESFGDNFVGIAIHQYSSQTKDAMNISASNYATLDFSGAPSCMIERGEEIDPYYGTDEDIRDDFRAAMEEVTPVGVEVSGVFNEDYTEVNATATVESLTDNSYNIEYVLIADSLSGTTTGWKQSNYYYQYSASQAPDDLAKFCSGGTYGKASISGLNFNDVAIASSYTSSKNQASLEALTAYTPQENTFTLTMPTYSKLLTAIKNTEYRNIYVAALIIDKTTGKILNAAKAKVVADPAGIESVNYEQVSSNKYEMFNVAGQRVNNSAKGILIINGKKVIK